MSATAGSAPVPVPATSESSPSIAAVVLRVAWLAMLLGIAMQVLLLAVGAAMGSAHSARPMIANLAQTVSWSTIVCVGVAIGTTVSKLREEMAGLAGLLSAPIAFNAARLVHKGVSTALGLSLTATGGPSPVVLGAIKAVEYGCLGAAMTWFANRGTRGVWRYALVGLFMGALFGGLTIWYLSSTGKAVTAAVLLPRAINEVLFPVGCSLVLYVSEAISKHWKSVTA